MPTSPSRSSTATSADALEAGHGRAGEPSGEPAQRNEPLGRGVALIDHVGFEVADLARSARFYDALFSRLGIRRVHESSAAIAYGSHEPRLWIVQRGRAPAPGYGHVAIRASGRVAVDAAYAAALAAGGRDDGEAGPPALRPQYGPRYYAAYVLDPDGLRVEVVAGGH